MTERVENSVAPASEDSVEERGEPNGSTRPSGGSPSSAEETADAQVAEDAAEPEDETERLRQERDSYLQDLKRLQAEFENYRKRILKEQTDFAERASAGVVGSLLGVLDNFDLAVAAAEETHDFEKMLRGVEMVYGELKEVLGGAGLSPIEAKGKPFDPNLHEAALEVPGSEEGELVVAEVLRPGYMLRGKVLRPAMVKVTRR